ncbi:MAG: peptidylprolyl isomerase [Pseudomonadota bacterium]|nr:peptidylprolyl isomerase [Pseudomonadota bacterium]
MKIENDRVVVFHYTVSESAAHAQGEEPLETSTERGPLAILVGHGNIIPGLDKAMVGHCVGESFDVDVPAAEAYGELQPGMTQRVPKKHFKGERLMAGMKAVLPTTYGPRAVTILKVGSSVVDIDLNHPMAGKDLHFAINVLDVREASAEEIAHGHVHGDGAHQH